LFSLVFSFFVKVSHKLSQKKPTSMLPQKKKQTKQHQCGCTGTACEHSGPAKKSIVTIPIPETEAFMDMTNNLLKGEYNSIFRAWFNQTHKYASLNLKMMAGSLGFGYNNSPYFALGSAKATTADFFINNPDNEYTKGLDDEGKPIRYAFQVDLHCWLEDDEGLIYDVFEHHWVEEARDRGRYVSLNVGDEDALWTKYQEIRGKPASILEQDNGLHYKKLETVEEQDKLREFIERNFRHQYNKFLATNSFLLLI